MLLLTDRRLAYGLIAGLVLGALTLAEASDELNDLEHFSNTVQSISAKFRQVTTDADGFALDQSDGHFYFQKPRQFRWSYREPFEEVIVGDGDMLWHFDPNLEQVTVRSQGDLQQSPILALTDWDLLGEAFELSSSEDSPVVELFPKNEQVGVVRAWVLLDNGLPKSVGWEDRFSQRTVIEFDGLEINIDLDHGLFEFEPPVGVDVLQGF